MDRPPRMIDARVVVEALRPEQVDRLVGRLAKVAIGHRLECARQAHDSTIARNALSEKAMDLEVTVTAFLLAVAEQDLEPF